jgi:outer membrane protein assembly factor BamB
MLSLFQQKNQLRLMRKNLFQLLAIWLVTTPICTQLQADNWPQWRGPNGNGVSAEKSLPIEWDQSKNVVWKAELPGQGGATPVVWGERMFVSSAAGKDLVLLCFDTSTGKQLWRQLVTSGNKDARAGEGNSASPSPATDGKYVWVMFSTGVLACFDFDGNQVWQIDLNERFGKIDIQFGLTSTPVLDGDALYLQLLHGVMAQGNDVRTGKVIKLNKLTGETVWEYDRITKADFECKHSYASPLMVDDGKRKQLIVHGADCTTGHDLQTGKEIWRLVDLNGSTPLNPTQYDGTFRFVSSPAFGGGKLIIPTAKQGPTVALTISDKLSGQLNDKQVSWTVPQTPDVAIPLIVDDLVYLLHNDGKLQCVELETGKKVYFERTHSVQHRSSPVYADGHIYFCGKDGMCTVVKAGREFKIVASNKMGNEPITASPVFANGTLYIRTYDALYAIRK